MAAILSINRCPHPLSRSLAPIRCQFTLINAPIYLYRAASHHFLSEQHLLAIQFALFAAPLAAVSAAVEPGGYFSQALALDAQGWGVLLLVSTGIYLFGTLGHLLSVRWIGPAATAALLPARLVSAVAAGYVVLGEAVGSGVEWAGLCLVVASVCLFLFASWRARSSTAARSVAGADQAGGPG